MNQEPSLAQAAGTSAQNIHEPCRHSLMASLPLYDAIIPPHVTCSNVIFRYRPHISTRDDTPSHPDQATAWGHHATMKGPQSSPNPWQHTAGSCLPSPPWSSPSGKSHFSSKPLNKATVWRLPAPPTLQDLAWTCAESATFSLVNILSPE